MTAAQQEFDDYLAARRSSEPEPDPAGLPLSRIAQPFVVLAMVVAGGLGLSALVAKVQAKVQANAEAYTQANRERQASLTAQVMAEKFVTQHLHCPLTAKYPLTADVRQVGNTWHVSSYVDSQNRFGAMLRSHWTVEMKADGDTWTLTNLQSNQ